MPARFAKVDSNVFRGGAPSPLEVSLLKNYWGVNKIISLDKESGETISGPCKDAGIEQIILPLGYGFDDENLPKLPDEVKQWKNGGKTYVHCFHGRDRCSLACAIYRVIVNGWPADEALKEAADFKMGEGLRPHHTKLYIETIKNCGRDNNASDDIVSAQRKSLNDLAPPANNQVDAMFSQKSFAPFSDGTNDYLNRPASKIEKMVRLADSFVAVTGHNARWKK